MGWALGYLRLPYLEIHHDFWIGFIACIGSIAVLLTLAFAWNKHSLLLDTIGKGRTSEDTNTALKTYRQIAVILAVLITLGISAAGFIFYQQNQFFEKQIEDQTLKIQQQTEFIHSVRQGNLVILIDHILDNLNESRRENPEDTLSDANVALIAGLSEAYKPFRHAGQDSSAADSLSPERGRLLLVLAKAKIDSSAFAKIKRGVSFSGADLGGMDLRNADLSGVDLRKANLKNADLRGANLKGADLRKANLWGANLSRATLARANLKRAGLQWSELNGADLRTANFNGANLTSAQLIKTNLRQATFQWAHLAGIILNESDFTRGDLFGANLSKANLTGVNLTGARLRRTDLSEAILLKVQLDHAELVDKKWLIKLDDQQPQGYKEIQRRYKVVNIESGWFDLSKYRLEKIDE